MGTNKAEELAQWVINNRYPKSELDKISDFEMYHEIVNKLKSYRQSEIDELTKEVERLRKERHILLLDFYKGLKNIGRLYSDNTSEEIMMNDVSEFLTTH